MRSESPQPFIYLFPQAIESDPQGALALRWDSPAGGFGQTRPLAVNGDLTTIHAHFGAFSSEECRKIVEIGDSLPHLSGGAEAAADGYRVSDIAWIEPGEHSYWLFHKLAVLFDQANRRYGFELTGFVEALQYTVYGAGQQFDWHMDISTEQTSARKLSMTLQLAQPHEYEGGNLEFFNAGIDESARQTGTAIFFPSCLAHRVGPVTGGVRRSLVAWAYGPAFT